MEVAEEESIDDDTAMTVGLVIGGTTVAGVALFAVWSMYASAPYAAASPGMMY
jgi:hypothetical protein